ncbi:MAG: ABC transporter ATP-binding protein, partial [Candidatus Sericytochromatia bacterium]
MDKKKKNGLLEELIKSIGEFKYSIKALELVWETGKLLTLSFATLTIISGLLPALIAYIGKLIIDAIILASKTGLLADQNTAIFWLVIEAIIVLFFEGIRRGLNISQSLLRAKLGQKVNVMILEKALTLSLSHFENSEFYDKMTRARREASVRPLNVVNKTFLIIQSIISLVAFGGLLLGFSPLSVLLLIIASIPTFIAETKFSNMAFRLFSWRTPETREMMYLETLIAREDHAKEVKLFQLGDKMLEKYKNIFDKFYNDDKNLTLKRGIWGYLLSLISTGAFYTVYAWVIYKTIKGVISLGEMTMYMTIFRQGQSTFSSMLGSIGGMYEDNLYLSNLYEYLNQDVDIESGTYKKGEERTSGIVFENV